MTRGRRVDGHAADGIGDPLGAAIMMLPGMMLRGMVLPGMVRGGRGSECRHDFADP
jgi:hypothetical protein